MNRRFALLALGGLVLAAPQAAAQSPTLDPALARRVDSLFARFTAPGSPGCAAGVVQDGVLSYAKGFGLASVELGVPITPTTVFDIGSVSKQFTALSIVLLAQDGKLSLDDEIQKFLPEVPRYSRPVTLRHLLHHTSGIRDYIDVLYFSGVQDESVTTDENALEAIVRQKFPNFEAGAEFRYSNSGFFLLSQVVKRVTGRTLREFAADRIFGPLEMTATRFVDQHEMIVAGKAGSYQPRRAGGFSLALANWEQTGDGAVNTTIEDLLKWDRNFYSGKVGGAGALKVLQTKGVLNDGTPITYALGLTVDRYRGLAEVSHGGSWAGFRAFLTRFPDQRTSVLALCNVSNAVPGLLAHQVADLVLAQRFPEPAPSRTFVPRPQSATPPAGGAPSQSNLLAAGVVGRYHSDELLSDWQILQVGDSLHLRIGPLFQAALAPGPDGEFQAAGIPIRFVEANGTITGLSITTRGARGFQLTKAMP